MKFLGKLHKFVCILNNGIVLFPIRGSHPFTKCANFYTSNFSIFAIVCNVYAYFRSFLSTWKMQSQFYGNCIFVRVRHMHSKWIINCDRNGWWCAQCSCNIISFSLQSDTAGLICWPFLSYFILFKANFVSVLFCCEIDQNVI